MRLTLGILTLFLLAGGCDCATAIAQANLLSGATETNPRFAEESDLTDNDFHSPTAAPAGLRYGGAGGAELPEIATLSQQLGGTASPASARSDTSYLTIDAPSAIAARESAEARAAGNGWVGAP